MSEQGLTTEQVREYRDFVTAHRALNAKDAGVLIREIERLQTERLAAAERERALESIADIAEDYLGTHQPRKNLNEIWDIAHKLDTRAESRQSSEGQAERVTESISEHIARDMREGRFPERSQPK